MSGRSCYKDVGQAARRHMIVGTSTTVGDNITENLVPPPRRRIISMRQHDSLEIQGAVHLWSEHTTLLPMTSSEREDVRPVLVRDKGGLFTRPNSPSAGVRIRLSGDYLDTDVCRGK